jgi:hypothetical protein
MSTGRLYCAYHEPTRTLLRVSLTRYVLELIRDGRLVASHHCSDPVSWSRDGLVAWDWAQRRVHLSQPDELVQAPQAGGAVVNGSRRPPTLHPDGTSLVSASREGLWVSPLDDPADQRLMASFADVPPRRIDPRRPGPGVAAPLPRDALAFPQVVFSEDGEVWIALDGQAVAIGRGSETLAIVHAERQIFFPPTAAFDLARDRVLLSGSEGLTAVTTAGEMVAAYRERRVTSGAVPRGDEVLVMSCVHERDPSSRIGEFEVLRLDAQTLAARGPLEGMPRHREGGFSTYHGLLVLPDGSVALVPGDGPVVLLPASDPPAIPMTSLVVHAGVERAPVLPHPSEAWYDRAIGSDGALALGALDTATSGERRSLARFLLDVLPGGDNRFGALASYDPDCFAPYRELLAAWDDDRLQRLEHMDGHRWFEIVRGASDELAARLAERIAGTGGWERKRLMHLLLGIGTSRALIFAGDLARAHPDLREVARDCCIAVPESGPAVRRFNEDVRVVIAKPRRGARAARPPAVVSALAAPKKALSRARGRSCRLPPLDVLTVDLDALGWAELSGSPLRMQRFFLSACECDEWQQRYVCAPATGGRVSIVGALDEDEDEDAEDDLCPGEPVEVPAPPRFSIEPPRPSAWESSRVVGELGGRPYWLQPSEVPDCPRCGTLMFYVGMTHPSHWLDIVPDSRLFGFHCERCGLSAQVEQCT